MRKLKNKLLTVFIVFGLTFLAIFIFFKANGVFLVTDDGGNFSKEENPIKNNEDEIPSVDNVDAKEEINIYLFWGDGCPRCEEMMSFLDSIEKEYGKYYNLIKYEVWKNQENSQLMNRFGEELNEKPRGVPYLVIGNVSISGYNPSKDEYIKKTIVDQYNSKDYVDIYEKVKQ